MLCSVSASKATLSTRRPLISSEPLKYRSNTSLPPRATRTACTLAPEATRRSAILHSAPRSMSLSSLAEATGQPSSRAAGTPQPSGGAAYTGNAVSGASAAPPRNELNRRRLIRSSRSHILQPAEFRYPAGNLLPMSPRPRTICVQIDSPHPEERPPRVPRGKLRPRLDPRGVTSALWWNHLDVADPSRRIAARCSSG